MKCPRCSFDNPTDTNYCGRCGMSINMDLQETFAYDKDTLNYIMEGIQRGTIIADRYEVIEELGGGGMGSVYKVFDRKINDKVALKLIRPEIAFDTKTVERFNNELKLARKVTHRNICRLYDLGEHGKLHFITMEYVSGQDLKRMIRMTRQLSIGTAVAIARQICEGLAESHRLGVVHRDLKPQNIMIDSEGSVKIMDFGIARSLYSKGVTMTGVLVGTPEYMSPEQAEASDVDLRTDIYALGIILFEMVTGEVPFRGETPLSIAIKHREEIPSDPCDLNSQVPEDLCAVILKCLEKKKERRYDSAEALLRDLTNIEQGIPTVERVIPKPKRKTDVSKRVTVSFQPKKIWIPVLIVMAAAIFALGIKWVISRGGGPSGKGEAITVSLGGEARSPRKKAPSPESRPKRPFDVVIPSVSDPAHREETGFVGPKDIADIMNLSKYVFGKSASDIQKASGVMQILQFGAANLLKLLSDEDIQGIIDSVDDVVASMDPEHPFREEWKAVVADIKGWQKLRQEGDEEKAEEIYARAMTRLNRLIFRLRIKESTDQSRIAVKRAWEKREPDSVSAQENLLFELASTTVRDADQAYRAREYDKAGILYTLAGELFTQSGDCTGEAECVLTLRELASRRRERVDRPDSQKNLNTYQDAKKMEEDADRYLNRKQYRPAAEFFLQAAVLYEESALGASQQR
jgi:serine/threonine protein kinase